MSKTIRTFAATLLLALSVGVTATGVTTCTAADGIGWDHAPTAAAAAAGDGPTVSGGAALTNGIGWD